MNTGRLRNLIQLAGAACIAYAIHHAWVSFHSVESQLARQLSAPGTFDLFGSTLRVPAFVPTGLASEYGLVGVLAGQPLLWVGFALIVVTQARGIVTRPQVEPPYPGDASRHCIDPDGPSPSTCAQCGESPLGDKATTSPDGGWCERQP